MTTIQKAAPGDVWLQSPGHLRPATIQETGQRTANLSCPTCGRPLSISHHEIAADGTVSPSLVCPWSIGGIQCGFHDHVKLDGWDHSGAP